MISLTPTKPASAPERHIARMVTWRSLMPGIGRGLRVVTHGAQLEAPRRMPEEHPDEDASREREEDRGIERRARHLEADEAEQVVDEGQAAGGGELARLRRHRAGRDQHVHQQIDHHGRGDEVEHDGGDDDMAAAIGLQIRRHRRPGGAERRRRHDRERDQQQRGQRRVEGEQHEPDAEPADIGLALAADVEQARRGTRSRPRGR